MDCFGTEYVWTAYTQSLMAGSEIPIRIALVQDQEPGILG